MSSWSLFAPWSAKSKALDEVDGSYRCIRCGAAFDRDHRECPDCGGQFVAPIPDGGEGDA